LHHGASWCIPTEKSNGQTTGVFRTSAAWPLHDVQLRTKTLLSTGPMKIRPGAVGDPQSRREVKASGERRPVLG